MPRMSGDQELFDPTGAPSLDTGRLLAAGYTYEDLAKAAIQSGDSNRSAIVYATLALNKTLEEIRDLLGEHT